MNGTTVEESGRNIILKYYSGICMERLRKTTKNLSHDSRSPGRYLNLGPPEYEAGVFYTRPRRSARRNINIKL
jgi:hypothetical protein